MTHYQKGAQREREVKALMERRGWFVVRGAGSKGADLLCLKAGFPPRMIEVKATKSAFSGFPPADRVEMLEDAERAGAEPLLAWWPYDRRGIRWLPPDGWPRQRKSSD